LKKPESIILFNGSGAADDLQGKRFGGGKEKVGSIRQGKEQRFPPSLTEKGSVMRPEDSTCWNDRPGAAG